MKNFLTHKFLPIMAVFMLVIFTLCTSCFAIEITNSNNEKITLPEFDSLLESTGYSHYFIVKSSGGVYPLDCYFLYLFNNCSYNSSTSTFSCYGNFYTCDGDFTRWSLCNSNKSNSISPSGVGASTNYSIYITDSDIYDTEGNLVFQVAPQATQLAQIVEQAETEKTVGEIVAILPLILVILVSFLGLRKALSWLSALLRRCLILLT